MKNRPLGNTGLEVSILGFGCAPLGDVYGGVSEAEGAAALHAALDAGITLVDVAPYYGSTLAEKRLGRALQGRRDEVILASKCCRHGLRQFDFSAARVHKDIDDSLRRLKTDHLDLLQVHDVEFGDRRQLVEETLPALEEVKQSGKARFIGITGLPVHFLKDLADQFSVDTVLSYCHYNLMADDLDDVLSPLVESREIGLLNASPLHMGILAPAGPQLWHPAPEQVKKAGRDIVALCVQRQVSVAEVALSFALGNESVSSTLCGMKSPAEVAANVSAMEKSFDPELLAEIAGLVAPVKNLTWHEGLAENKPPAL